jgi:ribosomal protein S27AE
MDTINSTWQMDLGRLRFPSIKLEDGILKRYGRFPSVKQRLFNPFEHPNLPMYFSKVHDAASAIEFEKTYAPLYYERLFYSLDDMVEKPDECEKGDPLEWVLYHSKYVRFALDLIHEISMSNVDSLKALIGEYTDEVDKDRIFRHPKPFPRLFHYPAGAEYKKIILNIPYYDEHTSLYSAHVLLDWLVNQNIKNIHSRLFIGECWIRGYEAVIETIWVMVGDIAIKAYKDNDNIYLRRCEYCGTPFLATHKKQIFCPPSTMLSLHGRKQSPCGLKYRQRKLQNRKKGIQLDTLS